MKALVETTRALSSTMFGVAHKTPAFKVQALHRKIARRDNARVVSNDVRRGAQK